MNYVYVIKIEGVVRYIGITNNIKTRQSQHRRDLKNFNGKGKYLYKMIRESGLELNIELEVIYEFKNRGDAARMECFLILKDYFGDKELYQSYPISIKYF